MQKHKVEESRETGKLIARFGRQRLVREASGLGRLLGGDGKGLTDAKEWIALFGQDVVLANGR